MNDKKQPEPDTRPRTSIVLYFKQGTTREQMQQAMTKVLNQIHLSEIDVINEMRWGV